MTAVARVSVRLAELGKHAGEHLGYSAWHRGAQDQVNLFAEATGDHQWIHVDEERAEAGSLAVLIL